LFALLLLLLTICVLFCKLWRVEVPAVVSAGRTSYIVPEGNWYIIGPVSGGHIIIKSNVSADFMVGVASAVFSANRFPNFSIVWSGTPWGDIAFVRDGKYYAISVNELCFAGVPHSFGGRIILVPEAIGYEWVDTYNELCQKIAKYPVLWRGDIRIEYAMLSNKTVILTMLFGLHGGGAAGGVPSNPNRTQFVRYYYQNTTFVHLEFDDYEAVVNVDGGFYIINMRPAVWIAVRPRSNALVTIDVVS
jgi:hypothetical protein